MAKKDLCERCGKCCRFKISHDGFWVAEDRCCPHFEWLYDGKGNCRIYGNHANFRIDENTICISAEQLAKARLLPESCPYAKGIPEYRSRVIGY
jgi:uncharacterized cysteine cluster protein YcgN (CxxCxxCC family)